LITFALTLNIVINYHLLTQSKEGEIKMENTKIAIRPFASKKGSVSFFICSLVGIVLFIIAFFITTMINNYEMLPLFGILSSVFIILGIVLFLLFPRVKIVFDSVSQNVTISSNKLPDQVIPFSELQPFQIYTVIRGYSYQYYCRNMSFGDNSDLFFSARHGKTLKKAKKLIMLTGGALLDYDGKRINPE
jgi:hypothetical protein